METTPSPFHFSPVLIVVYLVFIVLSIAGMWKVYTKAGKPGWACIIPFYNLIVLCEIIGKPIWWFLLMIFPCTSLIFLIWGYNLLSKSFGKGVGFTLGLAFPLTSPIFFMILGFGDAVYLGPSASEAFAANRFDSSDYQKPTDI
jgi:hypothetical protein